jgi:hypothetical protein
MIRASYRKRDFSKLISSLFCRYAIFFTEPQEARIIDKKDKRTKERFFIN